MKHTSYVHSRAQTNQVSFNYSFKILSKCHKKLHWHKKTVRQITEITEMVDELLTLIRGILCFSVMSEIAPGTSIPELPLCFLEAVIKPS